MLAAKQEVVDAAKQQLVGNTELLRQLQRRAGIAAAGEQGEVEAAFAAAIAEHEAKLRVAYAGVHALSCPSSFLSGFAPSQLCAALARARALTTCPMHPQHSWSKQEAPGLQLCRCAQSAMFLAVHTCRGLRGAV